MKRLITGIFILIIALGAVPVLADNSTEKQLDRIESKSFLDDYMVEDLVFDLKLDTSEISTILDQRTDYLVDLNEIDPEEAEIVEEIYEQREEVKLEVEEAIEVAAVETSNNVSFVEAQEDLLNLISSMESGGDYDAVVYGATIQPPAPVTTMTVGEVLAYQQEMLDTGSSTTALGKYQVLNITLDETGISHDKLFNKETQDEVAVSLLNRRGYKEFLSGELTRDEFANNLAKEWASFPVVETGESYYAGDGVHEHAISVDSVLTALDNITETKPPADEASVGLFQSIKNGISKAAATVIVPNAHELDEDGYANFYTPEDEDSYYITSPYGYRPDPMGSGGTEFHDAIDTAMADKWSPRIQAVYGGTAEVSYSNLYGNQIVLHADDGLTYRYSHLGEVWAYDGERLEAGDDIALQGSTGRSTGSHLDIAVYKDGQSLNPLTVHPNWAR